MKVTKGQTEAMQMMEVTKKLSNIIAKKMGITPEEFQKRVDEHGKKEESK